MALTTIKITDDPSGNPVVVENRGDSTYLEKTTLLPGRYVATSTISLTDTTSSFTLESFDNDVEGSSRIMLIASADQKFIIEDIFLELFDAQGNILYSYEDSISHTVHQHSPIDSSKSSKYIYGKILGYSEFPVAIADLRMVFGAYSGTTTPFDVTVYMFAMYPVPSVTSAITLPKYIEIEPE